MKIELEEAELQRVLQILSTAPWAQANPLIMKIGEQMQRQAVVDPAHPPDYRPDGPPKGHMGSRRAEVSPHS